jgi:putative DNA primase/helicase
MAGSAYDGPSNTEFMKAVFRDLPEGAAPVVVSIPGDIKKAAQQLWKGRPGDERAVAGLDDRSNNYFSLSAFRGGVRSRENFASLYVAGMDDVGTKSKLPTYAPAPSYRLRTSPGSEHWGYILKVPCSDFEKVKRFGAWLAYKGYTDRGTKDLYTRILRLPRGVNGKAEHGPHGFPHELLEWEPERRFDLEELAQGLGLDLSRDPPSAKPAANEPNFKAGPARTDAEVRESVLRSVKMRALWFDEGGAGGSEGDQSLLTGIARETRDAGQIERIYSQAPRADRVSSDGKCKWRDRPDYRERSIAKALAQVKDNPGGNLQEAAALVEEAVNKTGEDRDTRRLTSPEVVEALALLETQAPGDADFFRKEMKRLGVRLGTLDNEVKKARVAVTGQRDLSDKEAADAVLEHFGGRAQVAYARGQFLAYRKSLGIWQPLPDDEVKQAAQGVVPSHQITAAKLRSVLEVAKTSVFTNQPFDAASDKNSICCANGVLQFGRDGIKLMKHDPAFRHTSQVPVAWDALDECPAFDEFLASIFEGDEDADEKADFLRRAIGYSLTTSTDLEKFIFLYGPSSSNGKSTLLNLLAALVGKDNATSTNVRQLGERFAISELQGKLVCLIPEVQRGELLPDDKIKSMCSGDLITAERKGRDHFQFRPYATLWIASNSLPAMKDFSPALIEKRCVIVTMNRSFQARRDTGLLARLLNESPGIFAKCVRVYADALAAATPGTDVLGEPPSSVEAKRAWRQEADVVQWFSDECLMADVAGFVPAAELLKRWEQWLQANRVRKELSRKALTQGVLRVFSGARSGDGVRRGGLRGIAGVALVEDWED